MLNNKILRISAQLEDTLVDLFKSLRNDADGAQHIPAKLASSSCEFYRLKNPVSLVQDGSALRIDSNEFRSQVKNACSEGSNREPVDPIFTDVRSLADELSARHIYLVIEFPDGEYPDCGQSVFCVEGLLS